MKNHNKSQEHDWVTALPIYQHVYNSTIHKSIGAQVSLCDSLPKGYSLSLQLHVERTPFEVMYGRQSNAVTNPLFCLPPSQTDSDKGEEDSYIPQVVEVLVL